MSPSAVCRSARFARSGATQAEMGAPRATDPSALCGLSGVRQHRLESRKHL
jgi:hypothetical protein